MGFKLDMNADVNMTSFSDDVFVAPSALIERFGEPSRSDGYKVSGEYVFTDDDGNVYTVYDWKMTSLYYGEEDCEAIHPDTFWGSERELELHIGSHRKDVQEFKEWLLKEVGRGV